MPNQPHAATGLRLSWIVGALPVSPAHFHVCRVRVVDRRTTFETGTYELQEMAMPTLRAVASSRIGVIRSAVSLCCAMLVVHPAHAQQSHPPIAAAKSVNSATHVAQSDSGDLVPLFGWRDAAIAVGFGVATVALFQADRHVAQQSQDEITQANRFLKNVTKPAESLAWPGSLVIEGGLYAVGRLSHHNRMAEVGWHSTEAIVVATTATNVLKKLVGRARPYVSDDPHDFKFGGGFEAGHDRSSFPSGHTTTAFAFAAAVASESRTKWPHQWWSAWLIPVTVYSGATVVGISRLYHNQHWASDVALGAAIGTFSGIKVIQYAHNHPNNALDRFMLGTGVVPTRAGLTLMWSSAQR
jgi:membrane-associated phospholipid phosphatase